ncbi:helix-turn-helix transcriptional regulator [Streptomyces sp. NA04227]|uniref:helix-turn-helix domain-containing protein n=1 Tax=Streptomyces sp. NA04227 TaxID=2742136 RepID=UPI0015926048|nr:helix-turn-helix transcriptional regulator [Streptomyces sp. NA04227]QKW06710.1 helix-turn-helix transcriptional regulator [Streptomyces sp. NA04227]
MSVAHLLGAKVRKLREAAGLTQKDLGDCVHVSHTRIAKIELATDPPGQTLTADLDEGLNGGGSLVELWPHIAQSPYPNFSQKYIELQAKASVIHQFTQEVPGLLQTPRYATAQLKAGQVYGDWDLEATVAARLDRQVILARETPPWMWVILDEAALYRQVGGPDVMSEQLEHLCKLSAEDRMTIRVCPRKKVDPAAMSGSMTILTMPDGTRVAYLEGINSGSLSDTPDDVTRHAVVYDRLQANALTPEASLALISKVVEEEYSCPPSDRI